MGATGIQMRGAAGVVIDGGLRDLAGMQDDRFQGFPVLHRFSDPRSTAWVGVEYNVPVRIGGASVLPGDIVVGDDGGVLFFPPELLEKVFEYADQKAARGKVPAAVATGKKLSLPRYLPTVATAGGGIREVARALIETAAQPDRIVCTLLPHDLAATQEIRAGAAVGFGVHIIVLLRALVVAVVLAPVFQVVAALQVEPAGFALWSASALAERDVALSRGIGQDGSARETLLDYGSPPEPTASE